jgi:hypothetical protein
MNEPQVTPLLITPEMLTKQTDAMRDEVFDQLRAHLDDALSNRERRPWGWLARYRAELYFGFTLLAIAVSYRALSHGTDVPAGTSATTTRPIVTARVNAEPGSLLSEALKDADRALQDYANGNPSRTRFWIDSVANAAHFPPDRIDPSLARDLHETAQIIKTTGTLPPNRVSLVRGALYSYAYGRWVLNLGHELPEAFRIDSAFPGYDSTLVSGLVKRLDLVDVLGDSTRADDPRVATGVAIRWLQSYSLSADGP